MTSRARLAQSCFPAFFFFLSSFCQLSLWRLPVCFVALPKHCFLSSVSSGRASKLSEGDCFQAPEGSAQFHRCCYMYPDSSEGLSAFILNCTTDSFRCRKLALSGRCVSSSCADPDTSLSWLGAGLSTAGAQAMTTHRVMRPAVGEV